MFHVENLGWEYAIHSPESGEESCLDRGGIDYLRTEDIIETELEAKDHRQRDDEEDDQVVHGAADSFEEPVDPLVYLEGLNDLKK